MAYFTNGHYFLQDWLRLVGCLNGVVHQRLPRFVAEHHVCVQELQSTVVLYIIRNFLVRVLCTPETPTP